MISGIAWKQVTALALGVLLSATAQASQVELNLEIGQAVLPAGAAHKTYIKIGLEGVPMPEHRDRPSINVALVLDKSGSMSGDKMRHAKRSAVLALDHLQDEDIVSVVAYNQGVEVLVPATRLHNRVSVEDAIRQLETGGNTALFAGVSKGAAELRKFLKRNRINRVILLSDGLANVGPSEPHELGRLGRKLGGQGMSVTTIGLGLGYNEDLMVRLADTSDGNHVFAEDPRELVDVFRREFGELTTVVAQGVVISIQCHDGVRPVRVLGRDADIRGDRVTARLNQLYADQEKYLMLEVEVPEGVEGDERELVEVAVTYDNLFTRNSDRLERQVNVRYSASRQEIEASVNKEVHISASEQIGAEMDEDVLDLKQRGDVVGATKVLRRKADYLEQKAHKYESKRLMQQSQRSREAEEAVAAPAASPAWNKARKSLREEQYQIKKQQSYK